MITPEDVFKVREALRPHIEFKVLKAIQERLAKHHPAQAKEAYGILMAEVGDMIASKVLDGQDMERDRAEDAKDGFEESDRAPEFAAMSLTGRGLSRERLTEIRRMALRAKEANVVKAADDAIADLDADARGDQALDRLFGREHLEV